MHSASVHSARRGARSRGCLHTHGPFSCACMRSAVCGLLYSSSPLKLLRARACKPSHAAAQTWSRRFMSCFSVSRRSLCWDGARRHRAGRGVDCFHVKKCEHYSEQHVWQVAARPPACGTRAACSHSLTCSLRIMVCAHSPGCFLPCALGGMFPSAVHAWIRGAELTPIRGLSRDFLHPLQSCEYIYDGSSSVIIINTVSQFLPYVRKRFGKRVQKD